MTTELAQRRADARHLATLCGRSNGRKYRRVQVIRDRALAGCDNRIVLAIEIVLAGLPLAFALGFVG